MPREVLELMRYLYCRIATHDALANQDARKADMAELMGRYGEAEALRVSARSHRIRIMKHRSHVVLLEACFGVDGN